MRMVTGRFLGLDALCTSRMWAVLGASLWTGEQIQHCCNVPAVLALSRAIHASVAV